MQAIELIKGLKRDPINLDKILLYLSISVKYLEVYHSLKAYEY